MVTAAIAEPIMLHHACRPKSGSRVTQDMAERAHQVLVDMTSREVAITVDSIIDEAKAPDSPIHEWFSWDADEALRKSLRREARELIGGIEIVIEKSDNGGFVDIPVRGWFHVYDHVEDETFERFVTFDLANNRTDYRQQQRQQLLDNLQDYVIHRYSAFGDEFDGVIKKLSKIAGEWKKAHYLK